MNLLQTLKTEMEMRSSQRNLQQRRGEKGVEHSTRATTGAVAMLVRQAPSRQTALSQETPRQRCKFALTANSSSVTSSPMIIKSVAISGSVPLARWNYHGRKKMSMQNNAARHPRGANGADHAIRMSDTSLTKRCAICTLTLIRLMGGLGNHVIFLCGFFAERAEMAGKLLPIASTLRKMDDEPSGTVYPPNLVTTPVISPGGHLRLAKFHLLQAPTYNIRRRKEHYNYLW
jgi:hypothetical protein